MQIEIPAGVRIHLHIPELKSPLAPGFGQSEFLLGRSNKHLHLTLLTLTAPMCPIAALVPEMPDWNTPPPTALLLCCTSGDTSRVFNMSWQEGMRYGVGAGSGGMSGPTPDQDPRPLRDHPFFFWLNDDNTIGKHSSREPPMLLNLRVTSFDRDYKTCLWPQTQRCQQMYQGFAGLMV